MLIVLISQYNMTNFRDYPLCCLLEMDYHYYMDTFIVKYLSPLKMPTPPCILEIESQAENKCSLIA